MTRKGEITRGDLKRKFFAKEKAGRMAPPPITLLAERPDENENPADCLASRPGLMVNTTNGSAISCQTWDGLRAPCLGLAKAPSMT
jgi:hypothetical protein